MRTVRKAVPYLGFAEAPMWSLISLKASVRNMAEGGVRTVMQPMGLRVVLSTEETDLILRRGLLTFDTVASVPSFAHDQTNFGGEASG